MEDAKISRVATETQPALPQILKESEEIASRFARAIGSIGGSIDNLSGSIPTAGAQIADSPPSNDFVSKMFNLLNSQRVLVSMLEAESARLQQII